MSSHFAKTACPMLTCSIALSLKCSIASGNIADWCGSLATASHISCLVQGLPVHVGHPYVAYSSKIFAAGWCSKARPFSLIYLQYVKSGGMLLGMKNVPLCSVQYVFIFCNFCHSSQTCLFSWCSLLRSLLVSSFPRSVRNGSYKPSMVVIALL
jgi:hypothetical protein